MNLIVAKEHFSENVVMLEIEAPRIAKARKAGHFVIVRVDKHGERVPLTIAASNVEKGTITLVVQRIGVSTYKLLNLNVGDYVEDVVGPAGGDNKKFIVIVVVEGGIGGIPPMKGDTLLQKPRIVVIIYSCTRRFWRSILRFIHMRNLLMAALFCIIPYYPYLCARPAS